MGLGLGLGMGGWSKIGGFDDCRCWVGEMEGMSVWIKGESTFVSGGLSG